MNNKKLYQKFWRNGYVIIPNFLIDSGKKLILDKEKEFISLMLISGQIKLLKKISKILNLGHSEFYMKTKDRYFN